MLRKQDEITVNESRDKIIRKSFALTKEDLKNIDSIKDNCLNKKIVLSDSQVVRMALKLAVVLKEKELKELIKKTPRIQTGRPKKSHKNSVL